MKSLLAAFALAVLVPSAVLAAPACRVPADLQVRAPEIPPPGEIAAGQTIVYQLLTLTWSPEWCRTNGQGPTPQKLDCDGTPRGFTLHGLWPNGAGRPYPRYCTPVGQVDLATLRRNYCRTPSAELMQHEWQAHGGCGWTKAPAYFAQSAKLYDRIAIPKIEAIRPLTAGAVRQAFAAKNKGMTPEMIAIAATPEGRLFEVRVCHDLKFRLTACPFGNGPADATPLSLTASITGKF